MTMKVGDNSRVLLVDDDRELVEVLSMKLRYIGYHAEGVTNSRRGYELATQNPYDAIVLDITMPGRNGLDLCRDLRANGVVTPILILSGHAEKVNIVRGLELGADDYLTKPFSYNELSARLSALLRRNNKDFDSKLTSCDDFSLDIEKNTISYKSSKVELTKKETLLLRRLILESPNPVRRERLLSEIWGIDNTHTSNRLDVYIKRLRVKLSKLTTEEVIHTQRGLGYLFRCRKSG